MQYSIDPSQEQQTSFFVEADTIVAIATPMAPSAVGMLRLSGPSAWQVLQRLTHILKKPISHHLKHGPIYLANGELLDDAMWVMMHGPNSYTGEDVVELYVHGSPVILQTLLELCQDHGARLAQNGEFTKRAYLAGRIDLSQAEAVRDLIASESQEQASYLTSQLKGSLSQAIEQILQPLQAMLTVCRAALDFPEYTLGLGFNDEDAKVLHGLAQKIQVMLDQQQKPFSKKPHVLLLGPANAGKSTLLNALYGEQRALVDAVPGTTRDLLEATIYLQPPLSLDDRHQEKHPPLSQKLSVTLWDTAGFHEQASALEKQALGWVKAKAQQADRLIWLLPPDDLSWPDFPIERQRLWLLGSKEDLYSAQQRQNLKELAKNKGVYFAGFVSAQSGEGLGLLREKLYEQLVQKESQVHHRQPRYFFSLRQQTLLKQAAVGLKALEEKMSILLAVEKGQKIRKPLESTVTMDVVMFELESVCHHLSEMLGRDVDAEILEQIFQTFCIGK